MGARTADAGRSIGSEFAYMIGESPAFVAAWRTIEKLAACDVAVLIQGETGTGKELAARAIHYLGARRDGPFVPVNCGAIPDTLVESEFFGHLRGAFTDARDSRVGVIEQAEGGTLFLDELEALSPRGQVALLRFLQDHMFRPVGSSLVRSANVRVIGSSNVDLTAMTRRGEYRSDLLFRLNVLVLELPPLRQRRGDPALLAERFVMRFSAQHGRPMRPLDARARAYLESHDWPGNVRELENLVQRALLLSDAAEISFDGIVAATPEPAPPPAAHPPTLTHERFRQAKTRAVAEFERAYLTELLQRTRGNVSLAARVAGKERSRLGKLIRKYGLR